MTAEVSAQGALRGASRGALVVRSHIHWLRILVIGLGICASILFVIVGLRYELQMYADGSIFSYAVAAQDAWAFHWHNISGRLFVYLFCYVPSQTYVGLTGDARGGIDTYGFLFFVAQFLGLVATYAADRARGRIIFSYACASVACLCPLVFGSPTEMWMAHALFWPALAICRFAPRGIGGAVGVVAVLAALVLTHEGAVVFAVAIVCTLLLRGVHDAALRRGAGALLIALSIWALVKVTLRPDSYFASILLSVALNSIDITSLTCDLFLLLLAALASYAGAFVILRRLVPAQAHVFAAAIVAVALAAYWLWFDRSLHTDDRYYLRTALLIATPLFGALAAWQADDADGQLNLAVPLLPRLMALLARDVTAQAAMGAVLLVMLVHTVETAKFVTAWTDYKAAVRALATGTASDPELGDPQFVSSARIGADLNRLSWASTTPFLSVLVAPQFAPARLVVDRNVNYVWFSCATATANEEADRAIPLESRRLIRAYTCLYR